VVALDSGTTAHWVRFEDKIVELYDVAVLGGVRQPMAVGFKERDIIGGLITVGDWPERPARAGAKKTAEKSPESESGTSTTRRQRRQAKMAAQG